MEKKDANSSFLESFFFSDGDWRECYELSFSLYGSPKGLSYKELLDNPVSYDSNVYRFLEAIFNPIIEKAQRNFLDMIEETTELNVRLVQDELLFKANWQSVWKQCSPFLGFCSAFGVQYERGIDFLFSFIFSQAIPATEFDSALDDLEHSTLSGEWVGVFACVLNSCSLKLEASPFGLDLSKCIRRNSIDMYSRMVNDVSARRVTSRLKQSVDQYLSKDNGVRASVFFSIGVEAAAILAGKSDISRWRQVGAELSKVRQINDEILDFEEDLHIGSVTLPMIIAAQNPDYGEEFGTLLSGIWERKHVTDFEKEHYGKFIDETKALPSAGSLSAGILAGVVNTVCSEIKPEDAFLVYCLIGLRIGVLRRLYLNGWRDVEKSMLYIPTYNHVSDGVTK